MRCTVAAPGWTPARRTAEEIARLAPQLEITLSALENLRPDPGSLVIAGDGTVSAAAIRSAGDGTVTGMHVLADGENIAAIAAALTAGDCGARQAAHRRAVLRATSKTTDGIVSRHINRPISRTISGVLLAIPGLRPIHATVGTALLALGMIAALLRGDDLGLILGAVLFQAASIFDGVDGEIARATFRTSPSGAALDSTVDALTNLSFIAGVAFNLWLQGSELSARIGFTGLALLAVGLALIGRASAKSHAPFSFDVVKDHYRARSGGSQQASRIVRTLTFLTSRDFFALGFALLIALDLAAEALALFAVVAAGWLVAVIVALAPKHA